VVLDIEEYARLREIGKNPGGAGSFEVIVEWKARKAITRLPLRSTAV
jgi:hypothetical protein